MIAGRTRSPQNSNSTLTMRPLSFHLGFPPPLQQGIWCLCYTQSAPIATSSSICCRAGTRRYVGNCRRTDYPWLSSSQRALCRWCDRYHWQFHLEVGSRTSWPARSSRSAKGSFCRRDSHGSLWGYKQCGPPSWRLTDFLSGTRGACHACDRDTHDNMRHSIYFSQVPIGQCMRASSLPWKSVS